MIKNAIAKDGLLEKIKEKGFFHLLSANVLIQFVAFASQLLVASILLPEEIGQIKILITYLSIFTIVSGLGLNTSTLKLCSENRSEQENEKIFKVAFKYILFSSIATYLIILGLNALGFFATDPKIQNLFPLAMLPVIGGALFLLFVSYFQAQKKIKTMSRLVASNKLIAIILIVSLTYFYGIKGYFWAQNIGYMLIIAACLLMVKNLHSIKVSGENIKYFREHWKYSKFSLLSSVVNEIAVYIDILLIGFFITDKQTIGYYSFALTLTVILRLIPSTVQQITVPYFSALMEQKEPFLAAFKRYNRLLQIIVAITLIVVILLFPSLLTILFQNKYDGSIPFFIILSIGWSIRQLNQLTSGALFGLGRVDYSLYINTSSLIFNTITMIIALHFWGLMGAAYASILCNIFVNIIYARYFKKAIKAKFVPN